MPRAAAQAGKAPAGEYILYRTMYFAGAKPALELEMAQTNRMTNQQLDELVAIARENTMLWATLKHREEEMEAFFKVHPTADPPAFLTRPAMPELVHSLIEHRYGRDHHYVTGDVIIAIRRQLRIELGYPTYGL